MHQVEFAAPFLKTQGLTLKSLVGSRGEIDGVLDGLRKEDSLLPGSPPSWSLPWLSTGVARHLMKASSCGTLLSSSTSNSSVSLASEGGSMRSTQMSDISSGRSL